MATPSTVLSGPEIQARIVRFVKRWSGYSGTERSEAQTFLNELFAAYGSDRRAAGAVFEDSKTSQGIMDLRWGDRLIVEMKAPGETAQLEKHRKQALDYWRESSDPGSDSPAAQYVVLCSFHRFEIWEPGRYPTQPRADFPLSELADHYEKLLFLTNAGDEALFHIADRRITTDAAQIIGRVNHSLMTRDAAPPEVVQNFLLQMVWLFFAERFNMISGHPSWHILREAKQRRAFAPALIGGLLWSLNQDDPHLRHGVLKGTAYVNGGLFSRPAVVELTETEIDLLLEAGEYEWDKVNPTIFGSLVESFLGEKRGALGAHYTHEADIMKIVRPTIVQPWQARIDAAETFQECHRLLQELCDFKVLDPACGSGNFLYVAYRELRGLEKRLKERLRALAKESGFPIPGDALPFYPLGNLYGIDVVQAAVQVAQLTLWMGHRQVAADFEAAERFLPLTNLEALRSQDALKADWPEVDCVIGNPPFVGSQHLRSAQGDEYLDFLKDTFGVGIKDFCVYWFRKTHDHLKPGQRAGLIGTNSIRQPSARAASLGYVVDHGGVITDAISSQVWPGEAKVHVSIANWVKEPGEASGLPGEPGAPGEFVLDGELVSGISSRLQAMSDGSGDAVSLSVNRDHAFQGPIPIGAGFILDEEEAQRLLARGDADYRDVVRPYLVGDDIADDPGQRARRWVIDFGLRALEEANAYPAAMEIVRERVKPIRETNNRKIYKERWWLFGEPRRAMRLALEGKERYISCQGQGKRALFIWTDAWTCPSNLVNVFAFDDDYSMGILSSAAHVAWSWAQSGTLKADLRYSPSNAFMTFPWPDPVTEEQRERIAEASREIIARRQQICETEQIGLTALYNQVDEGAYADLKKLHLELDKAVAAAYGWSASVAQDHDELVARLLKLNQEIAEGKRSYSPFPEKTGEGALQPMFDV
ncbi:hypothetical protein HDA32_005750 [Spinactinospora alkalitolerans]|uniref:site-specific DNA-methyltransferase (adenine-specific) n=1 Tax=Spinactinospora alkalitolerans TaxID=687207 RepID=A0A852U9K3_9ACTN|nr:class I SAM-dependent DNA methyltransferase [Spinactinospora alkalitolerans]NYE50630.1 hypothetical protein [Spinactinospora alkalitolerans]